MPTYNGISYPYERKGLVLTIVTEKDGGSVITMTAVAVLVSPETLLSGAATATEGARISLCLLVLQLYINK